MSISQKQYEQLCKLCDQILKHDKATRTTIANAWLHPVRWHSELLIPYISLFQFRRKLRYIKHKLFFLLRNSASTLIRILQAVTQSKMWLSSSVFKKTDILLVSHLINPDLIGKSDDFYFGNLAHKLNKLNLRTTIILINYRINIFHYRKKLNLWKNERVSRIILGRSSTFLKELKIYFAQHQERRRLKKYQTHKTDNLYAHILSKAASYVLSSATANNLRLAHQIAEIIEKTKPKFIITTYEGHAWERLVFQAAKNVNPNIKCIGYQHAAIFPLQHALKRALAPNFNPDVILTPGEITKKQLEKNNTYSNIKIAVLGSQKSQKICTPKLNKTQQKTCLIIPDGFKTECYNLFKFSLSCARTIPGVKFIWRLHPLMNFDTLIKNYSEFKNLPSNIRLSTDDLVLDIKHSSHILYRGSTVVINAITSGLIPIYFTQEDELNNDPLYELKHGRAIVETTMEFQYELERKYDKNTLEYIINYGKKYYTPMDEKILLTI